MNFNLGSTHFANARAMIDAGAALALTTDINPGSAPCPCRFTWMREMWLSLMVENAAPRCPTMPACSQSRIVLRRTVWEPT